LHAVWLALAVYRVGPKNDLTCFCKNFVKSSPNLINFGTQTAKMIELCMIHSLSTAPNLCQHTTM